MNLDMIKDNTLLITNSSNKKELIKRISSLDRLVNIKVMTIKELIDNYYFTYDEKTIYYLMNKYNIKYSIARKYIDNMYYVNETVENEKINNIYKLRQELIENNLLYVNDLFKAYLSNRNIILYNIYHIPNIVMNILDNYTYEIVNDDDNNYIHEIIEYNSLNDEVVGCSIKIVELIKKGIDINNIYIANLNDEYRLIIKRIFKMFNIPVNLNVKYSIYNTHTCRKFLEYYDSDINNTLSKLKEDIKDNEIDIYNKLINICNKYVWCNDYLLVKELIINDLKNTNLSIDNKTNSVNEINIESYINDDDHIFLLGFNQGIIPVIHKDEDYLSDKDKLLLNLETSIDNNLYEKDKIVKIIKNINNLYISYKLKSLTDTFSISNINEELNYEVIKGNINNYSYSNIYNKILLSSSLDLFNKYGTITTNLDKLYNNYKDINYRLYDNSFKGIDNNLLYKYLDNKLLLSYSSLDNYHRCNFRYYLNNILKISPYEESFMQLIGNLFHYVLSSAFNDNFNYDECFDNYIEKELTKKEKFFVNKLKKELLFIIDTIKEHNSYSKLDNELYEDKIYVNLEGNIKVTFMGIIDKIKYKEVDGKYVCAIIDYKTGNPNLNLNNIVYGIEMQLPIYLYLANNHPKFSNIEFAGFYLQKILNNEIVAEKRYTYEDLKKKNLLLQGYSNDNLNILELFDSSYEDSKVVKSLKVSSKGFYAYSKVLNSITIDKLIKISEDKIKEASRDIMSAKFDINPKRIGINNVGCEFCSFKDICYRKEKDIVNLKEYKNMEFLGGEDNA